MERILSVAAIGSVLTLAALSACESRPGSPTEPGVRQPGPIRPLASSTLPPEEPATAHLWHSIPRLALTVEAVGPIRINEPITIRVTATANVESSSALVRVTLPEWEAAKLVGPALMRMPVGQRLPRVGEWTGSFLEGETRRFDTEVVITVPGYYRVSVAADARRAGPAGHGTDVVNFVATDLWLYLADGEERTTEDFDPSLIPPHLHARPGPFLPIVGSDELSPEVLRPASLTPLPSGTGSMSAGVRAVYYDVESEELEAIADALVQGYLWDDYWGVVDELHTRTDEQGYFDTICFPGQTFVGWVILDHSPDFYISGASKEMISYGCAGVPDQQFASRFGRVWANLLSATRESESLFGRKRSMLEVLVPASGTGCTNYSPSHDWLRICPDRLWGDDGRFVAAHELGHAFHHDALGGIQGSCPTPRYAVAAHTLACALFEGFASYYAVAVMADSILDMDHPHWLTAVNDPHGWKDSLYGLEPGYWCEGVNVSCPSAQTIDGSRAELAVAAFLTDVAAAYGHEFVADVLTACQVRHGGTWYQSNGVDFLIYCFERRIDASYMGSGYFATRSTLPQDWSASVSLPGNWDADDIMDMWQARLYPVAPPPPPEPEPLDTVYVWHNQSECPNIEIQLSWTNNGPGSKRIERDDGASGNWSLVAAGVPGYHTSWPDSGAPADEFIVYRVKYEALEDWTYSDVVFTSCTWLN